MRIVGRDKLYAFVTSHADARSWIAIWLQEAEGLEWRTPQDIKGRYATASFLPGNVVIFNLRGNKYRMELLIAYRSGVVVVQWIGTHNEYDERNRRRK